VERGTAEWVRWYNNERFHSSIDYMTPIDREIVYAHAIAQRARWPEPQPLANPGRFTGARIRIDTEELTQPV
jgi:hypothetical protein